MATCRNSWHGGENALSRSSGTSRRRPRICANCVRSKRLLRDMHAERLNQHEEVSRNPPFGRRGPRKSGLWLCRGGRHGSHQLGDNLGIGGEQKRRSSEEARSSL